MTAEYRHQPVMLDEVDGHLALKPGEVFCDCTIGGAGHALPLSRRLAPDGLLIGIDRDPEAAQAAADRLKQAAVASEVINGNFADLDELLLDLELPGVDAFLFDLGVSSHQLDSIERGFSYSREAPLDMRMDPGNQTLTAAEVVNSTTEANLARILHTYGEERFASRIAKAIVARRAEEPFLTTAELAEVIRLAIPAAARRKGGHPAKRSFQALRIYVNSELDALDQALEAAMRWLNPAGRIVAISYHSLEDRIVKQAFATASEGCICPPEAVLCVCGRESVFELITRKPVTAGSDELAANPRSASAKLRAISRRSDEDENSA